jgi:hypothetical protein
MFSASQQSALSEYISQFIQKARNPQSDLKQIPIPISLKAHSSDLGFKFKTSFGQGSRTHIPWLACLANDQGASVEGVYPVLLFHTKTNSLFVTYGESETAIKKRGSWPTEWPNDVIAKLPHFPHSQFGEGKVLREFDCSSNFDVDIVAHEFLKIVNLFLELLAQTSPNLEQLKTTKMDELAQHLHESTSQIGLTFSMSP